MSEKLDGHEYEYENVVIGNNIHSLIYAYTHGYPFLYQNFNRPHNFKHFDSSFCLKFIGEQNILSKIVTNKEDSFIGIKQNSIIEKILFLMSWKGLLPFLDTIDVMRIEEDDVIKIQHNMKHFSRIRFEKLFIFNPRLLKGLQYKIKHTQNIIEDFFIIQPDRELICDVIYQQTQYPNTIYKKNNIIYCKSWVSNQKLKTPSYSPTPLRIFLQNKLKDYVDASFNTPNKEVEEDLKLINLRHQARVVVPLESFKIQNKNVFYLSSDWGELVLGDSRLFLETLKELDM